MGRQRYSYQCKYGNNSSQCQAKNPPTKKRQKLQHKKNNISTSTKSICLLSLSRIETFPVYRITIYFSYFTFEIFHFSLPSFHSQSSGKCRPTKQIALSSKIYSVVQETMETAGMQNSVNFFTLRTLFTFETADSTFNKKPSSKS